MDIFKPQNINSWHEQPRKEHSDPNAKDIERILQLLTPMNVLDRCKFRIGHINDGGRILLDHKLDEIQTLMSIGVGSNTYFEEAIARQYRHIEIHLFDSGIT